MSEKLKVVDFFCGAGGFSEGFRQAGFDVICAIDLWQPAVDTHIENHPETKTLKDDIIRISLLPDVEFHKLIPDSEVIIGSPPCTAFSNSNKSGKGDKAKGIALIEAYLRIIARKKYRKNSMLKYWILENVPKVKKHIKDSYSAKDLKLEGEFTLDVKGDNSGVYNAKYYGVPSSRNRFFCGEFPTPLKKTKKETELIPLKTITQALGKPSEKLHQIITDPIYGIEMRGEDVSDHHYIQELAEFEWKTAKRLKQDKGYMGKMSLPENSDKPARTIMATMSFSARESFILGIEEGRFRAPTIREVATLMSFPLDYRFYGSSIGTKYKLVGNAVPPKMANSFAKAILRFEQKSVVYKYLPLTHANQVDFINLNLNTFHINKEKEKKSNAKFKYHIPYYIHNAFRVELTNRHSDFDNKKIFWGAEIHYSQGDRAKIYTPKISDISFNKEDIIMANKFLEQIKIKKSSGNKFQEIYCKTSLDRQENNLVGPFELLDLIKSFIDTNFIFIKKIDKLTLSLDKLKEIPRATAIGYYLVCKSIEIMKLK